jgi:hypothetical protein
MNCYQQIESHLGPCLTYLLVPIINQMNLLALAVGAETEMAKGGMCGCEG